jgi:hypothetical protein
MTAKGIRCGSSQDRSGPCRTRMASDRSGRTGSSQPRRRVVGSEVDRRHAVIVPEHHSTRGPSILCRWRKDPPCISRLPLDRYQLWVEKPLPIPRRPVVGCLRPRVDDDLVDQEVQQLPAPLQAMRPHAFSSVMAGEVPSSGELAATRSMARPSVSKRAERRFWPPGIRQTSAGRSNRAPESRAAGFACLVLCEVPAKGAGFLGLRDKVRKRRAVEPEVHSLTAQKVLRWALELRLASAF